MKEEGYNAAMRYHILMLGLKSGNISQLCSQYGISRTIYYRWRRAFAQQGLEGLENKERQRPRMKNQIVGELEKRILDHARERPEDGPRRIAYDLQAQGYSVSESGVYNVLRRGNLSRRCQRQQMEGSGHRRRKTEAASRAEALWESCRHKGPGFLVLQDVSCLGRLCGKQKLYLHLVLDGFTGCGLARLYPHRRTENLMELMEMILLPRLRALGVEVENLLTKSSLEFTTSWDNGTHGYERFLREAGISHCCVPAGHPALAPVRRFQEELFEEWLQPFLEEHGAFELCQLEEALDGYLRYYNYQRPISSGRWAGEAPFRVFLETAPQREALPLWAYAGLGFEKGEEER